MASAARLRSTSGALRGRFLLLPLQADFVQKLLQSSLQMVAFSTLQNLHFLKGRNVCLTWRSVCTVCVQALCVRVCVCACVRVCVCLHLLHEFLDDGGGEVRAAGA